MSEVEDHIRSLEEQLRQAELGPDPHTFEKLLDDNMVLVFDNKICRPKRQIVEAHTPGQGQKFDSVTVQDLNVVEHGETVVVTCAGIFDGEKGKFKLEFMRVWSKKGADWKVVAGSMFTAALDKEK